MFTDHDNKVYAFDLLDKTPRTHWGHKPTVWDTLGIVGQQNPLYRPDENMTVLKALNYCRSAPMRGTPYGPNEVGSFTTSNKKTVEKHCLYGLVSKNYTDDQIVSLVGRFVTNCGDERLQSAYFCGIKNVTQFKKLLECATPGTGDYWAALETGLQHVQVKNRKHLNEVFMDAEVEKLVHMQFPDTCKNLTRNLWPSDVQNYAFGTNNNA